MATIDKRSAENVMVRVIVADSLPAGIEPVDLQRTSLVVYREMIDQGLIPPDDRVELLDGLMVKKIPGNPPHAEAVRRLVQLFSDRLPEGWRALKEDTIELPGNKGRDSAPIPDVTIVSWAPNAYALRHPGPRDVVLVVEVASNPRLLARDRGGLVRYARARIPAVWIVDLAGATVEVYTAPRGVGTKAKYGPCAVKRVGDVAQAVIGEGGPVVVIPVAAILGLVGP